MSRWPIQRFNRLNSGAPSCSEGTTPCGTCLIVPDMLVVEDATKAPAPAEGCARPMPCIGLPFRGAPPLREWISLTALVKYNGCLQHGLRCSFRAHSCARTRVDSLSGGTANRTHGRGRCVGGARNLSTSPGVGLGSLYCVYHQCPKAYEKPEEQNLPRLQGSGIHP